MISIWVCPAACFSEVARTRQIVRGINKLAAQRLDLGAALQQHGAFLDVGTGVGWLAIEAARSWPAVRVVGIDSWEPALALARKNLSLSGIVERVELRSQRVEHLADERAFILAWLPGPFIPTDIAAIALERIHRALAPGGWLIFGLHPQPPTALGQALATLRMVRGGCHPWTTNEVEERLDAHGFERIEAWSPFPPIMFVLGQRPDISDSTKIVN